MATIVWCDHVRHIVQEPQSEVMRLIGDVLYHHAKSLDEAEDAAEPQCSPIYRSTPYVWLTPVNTDAQRGFNVGMVSTVEAMPGDGV